MRRQNCTARRGHNGDCFEGNFGARCVHEKTRKRMAALPATRRTVMAALAGHAAAVVVLLNRGRSGRIAWRVTGTRIGEAFRRLGSVRGVPAHWASHTNGDDRCLQGEYCKHEQSDSP